MTTAEQPTRDDCVDALRAVVDAIQNSPFGDVLTNHGVPYRDDFHIQITLTAAECIKISQAVNSCAGRIK